MQLHHGGDWMGYVRECGGMPLDFSASISPLPLPEGVRQAAFAALEGPQHYPDPLCRALRDRLSRLHGVPPEHILCGAGAADLILRLALAVRPRRAMVLAPTFGEYKHALDLAGCRTEEFVLREEDGFAVTERLLPHISPELDLLFLCQPNNPTGRTVSRPLLEQIAARCTQCGVILALDECFLDFLADPAACSLAGQVEHCPNLVVFRAFTKFWGMAGLRLGYVLCGNAQLLSRMYQSGQPWPVSAPAQAAGAAALEDRTYGEALRTLIRTQRPVLTQGLSRLGCGVCPGEANFLLFYHQDTQLCQKLRQKGILLRDCSGFSGLGPGWYRTSIRTQAENQALLCALEEVM